MVLHFILLMVLMEELGWVIQMAPVIVLMKENLSVTCLDHDLEKNLALRLLLLMVLMKEIWLGSTDGSFDSSNEGNLSVSCSDHEVEKKFVLHLLLLMVLMKELGWVIQMACLIVLMKADP